MEELELALDDCLQQLASGKLSLAQCLARYPKQAAELRPLLETALKLQQGKSVRPSGALRGRARAQLAEHMEAHPRKARKARRVPKPAEGLLALALAAFFVGTAFAQDALPGQLLYSLKLSTERAWRATASNPVSADLALANRRTLELIQLSRQQTGKADNMNFGTSAESQGLAAYKDVLDRLANEANGPESIQVLTSLEERQTDLLQAGIHLQELDDIVSHGHENNGKGHGPKNKP